MVKIDTLYLGGEGAFMITDTKVRQDSVSDIQLGKHKNRQLQPNPFTTYRDPETGRWVVIKPVTA